MEIRNGGLRSIKESDLKTVLTWRNSERIRSQMFSDHIINEPEHRSWFESLLNHNTVVLIFECCNRPVGLSDFKEIDEQNHRCIWGFYLGESDLPRGTGLLMGYLSMEYAFNTMNMRKVYSEVLATNTVSLSYHKKLGFVTEGVLRQHVIKQNQYIDVSIFGLLKSDWEHNRAYIERALQVL